MKKTRRAPARNLLGGRIRQVRLRLRPPVSQEDLAGRVAALGVTLDRSAVSRIESQDRYLMDYELVAIAKALRVSVMTFFEDMEGT